MDDDYVLVHSPLETRLAADGLAIEVLIYRGEDEDGWILEVVDHLGGSTVWDDRFPTDQAAYEAVTRAIVAEGIASFTVEVGPTLH